MALGIRAGGIIVGLFAAPSLALLTLADGRRQGWKSAAQSLACGLWHLLPAFPVALAVWLPAWPLVALASGNFLDALGYLSRFPYTADTIFAGQRYPAPALTPGYWPVLLVLQLPELVLAGLLLATVLAASSPSFLTVGRDVGAGLVAAGLTLRLVRIVQLHPYEYVYFNDVSGGVAAAAGRYELDYWGASFGELGRMLEARLGRHHNALGLRPIPARICGPFETAQEVLPPSLVPVHHNAPARLAVAIDIFFCVPPPPGSELARVERKVVVLSRAYRISPEALITSYTNP